MIFVTTGTHEQPFDRLVEEIDRLKEVGSIWEDVFIQLGYSDYKPNFCEYSEFIGFDEMKKKIDEANIVITHGGPGSIILVLYREKVPIVVPRQKKYREHVDDHQVYFCKRLEEKGKVIAVYEIEEMKNKIVNYEKFAEELERREKTELDLKEKLLEFTKALDEVSINLTESKEKTKFNKFR